MVSVITAFFAWPMVPLKAKINTEKRRVMYFILSVYDY
jgi:hypothetical protein